MICFYLLFLLLFLPLSLANTQLDNKLHPFIDDGGIMLVSTLDGYLTAIDPRTGIDKWKFQQGPILESPVSIQQGFTFIPNPTDGQLYVVVEGRLSKLPFTIPQLVKVSPCRSSDGILYAGNKKDIWISINPETGERSEGFSAPNSFCPVSQSQNVFIGKTEYHISMLDTKKKDRQWNATFIDYSSHLLPADTDLPYKHFTSSMDGSLVAVDAHNGEILWQREFESVIVNMYLLKQDGMHRLESTVIGKETFDSLLKNAGDWADNILQLANYEKSSSKTLYPSLFIGQSSNTGLYALPAYVDSKTFTITPKYIGPALLEGPMPIEVDTSKAPRNIPRIRPQVLSETTQLVGTTYKTVDGEYLLLGYYEPPEAASEELMFQTAPASIFKQYQRFPFIDSSSSAQGRISSSSTSKDPINKTIPTDPNHYNEADWTLEFIFQQFWKKYPNFLILSFASVFLLIITTVWLCGRHSAVLSQSSTSSGRSTYYKEASTHSQPSRSSRSSGNRSGDSPINKLGDEILLLNGSLEEEWYQVGKLHYNAKAVLGMGCAGTIVYKGLFDGREVAVKRVMSDLIELIDREINHLRESDSHHNVIRYFCSESDRDFRYIALELCECNLEDYVKNLQIQTTYDQITHLEILKQASDGIAHLHNIDIVHRDVKPRNILLSSKDGRGRARVLISDFGLCKKIKVGHDSISKMSGMAGTDGWMAPEIIIPEQKVTRLVDVFSLGCIFYYVITGGNHPFGENIRRQENIRSGQYNLQKLIDNSDFMALNLIEAMLDSDVEKRPTAKAVAAHPMFWSKERQLQFLMDVSDRVEKEEELSLPVQRLERNNLQIVGGNWRNQLSRPLQEDLLKFRSYRHNSVRDLLRALRNKKHHYRELSEELRLSLGSIPNEYLLYFTSKFPRLLIHAYIAMNTCANESIFQTYYPLDLQRFNERILQEELKSAIPFSRRLFLQQSPITQHHLISQCPKANNTGFVNVNTTLKHSVTTPEIYGEEQLEFFRNNPPPNILPDGGAVGPATISDVNLHGDVPLASTNQANNNPTKNKKSSRNKNKKNKTRAPLSTLTETLEASLTDGNRKNSDPDVLLSS